MFAVVRTGGKQYKVAKDDTIVVERLAGDAGTAVQLDDVLMIGGEGTEPNIGAPKLDKAAVFAEVVEQTRGDKIIVFKKNRRKGYRRKAGHRQNLTVLRITDISATGTRSKAKAKAEPKAEPKAKAKAEPKPKAEPKAKAKPAAKAKKPAAKAAAKPKPKAKASGKSKE